jgi:purine-binding chemotaxis protein CheW
MSGHTDAGTGLRVIRCGAGGEACCVDLAAIRGIERGDRLREGAPPDGGCGWLAGGGGAEVPVYRLASLLGRTTANAAGPILVLALEAEPWALQVDTVSRVLHLPAANRRPLPARLGSAAGAIFQGLVEVGEELLLHLRPERLRAADADGHPPTPHTDAAAAPGPPRRQPASSAAPRRSGQLVLFSAGRPAPGEHPILYGLSATQVPEILQMPPILAVPRAPAPWLGLVSWRGQPLPVLDLPARLGLAAAPDVRRRLLVARGATGTIGILVEPGVRMAPAASLRVADRPSHRSSPLDPTAVRGIAELAEETLVIPDLDNL